MLDAGAYTSRCVSIRVDEGCDKLLKDIRILVSPCQCYQVQRRIPR